MSMCCTKISVGGDRDYTGLYELVAASGNPYYKLKVLEIQEYLLKNYQNLIKCLV